MLATNNKETLGFKAVFVLCCLVITKQYWAEQQGNAGVQDDFRTLGFKSIL